MRQSILLLCAIPAALASQQPPDCTFKLNEPSVKEAAITGADGIKVPIFVTPQPDSPLEILAVDFTGYTFDSQRGPDGIYRHSYRSRCTAKVRNRSNLPIRSFEITVGSNGLHWTQPGADSFNPGQEMELLTCNGGGSGHGPRPPGIVILVALVEFDGCSYQPSQPRHSACDFKVGAPSGKETTVTGADDIKANLHVVQQPDSPLEILAVDFTGSTFDVERNEDGSHRYTERIRCKVRVRNRSDREIHRADVVAQPGVIWRGKPALAPGEELELANCAGNGHGGSQHKPVIPIFVERVDFESCSYLPSLRIPHALGPDARHGFTARPGTPPAL